MRVAAFLLALQTFPACAGVILDQSPPNGNAIDFTNGRVADGFSFSGAALVNGVNFWYQTDIFGAPSDLSQVAWAFYANAGGSLGTQLYSGTATPATSFDAINNADLATFAVPNLSFSAGTYWLELHAGSSLTDTNNSLTVFWSNIDGTRSLPVLINSGLGAPNTEVADGGFQVMAFQLGGSTDSAVPEPAGSWLLGSGLTLLICGVHLCVTGGQARRPWRRP